MQLAALAAATCCPLQRLVCPREVVWLNGAPGSGKGSNLQFIMKSRGLSRAVGMSQLLDTSPDIKVRAGPACGRGDGPV